VERPQAAVALSGRPNCRRRRPRTNDLDAGRLSGRVVFRRVRASAERGRVQGPGRAEADFGPRTITVACNSLSLFSAVRAHRFLNCLVGLLGTRIGTPSTTLIPTLMGTRIPTLMGTQATRVPGEPGLGLFALVRRSAGQGHGQKPPVTLPRYAT
jgi:hypothetical protein